VVGAATCAAAAVAAAPVVATALGFGAAGIVAGTPAAWMMSTYGGSVAAGSAVATLQSIGAVGVTAKTAATVYAAGAMYCCAGARSAEQLKKRV